MSTIEALGIETRESSFLESPWIRTNENTTDSFAGLQRDGSIVLTHPAGWTAQAETKHNAPCSPHPISSLLEFPSAQES